MAKTAQADLRQGWRQKRRMKKYTNRRRRERSKYRCLRRKTKKEIRLCEEKEVCDE